MDRVAWLIAIFVLIVCGLRFIIRGLKKEVTDEKIMMFGFAGLFLGNAMTRIFYFISDFYIVGVYRGHTYYGNLNNTYPPYDIILLCGYLSFLIGT